MPIYEIDTLGKAVKKYAFVAALSFSIGFVQGFMVGYRFEKQYSPKKETTQKIETTLDLDSLYQKK